MTKHEWQQNKHASLSNLKNDTNFLYFSFTTRCLEIKLCSIHFIVTTLPAELNYSKNVIITLIFKRIIRK
ncbi:hypothetical protein P5673_022582 [Acropora cervicornis]|uniref:Uncharacterized protein n=1 Tax=Acropora cervicornis TaxID=6130 RepID=A0AAD9Q6F0_ACRCE|nr:hypothetical protein P5673_022582 [Acropora cervicornis]